MLYDPITSRGLSPVRQYLGRLRFTLLAQFYNQLVTAGVQLALVPILLHEWGVELYGAWILLTAFPTYLSFSDFGFTLVAKNEMTMAVAGGDHATALKTYQSTFVLLLLITAALLLILGLTFGVVDLHRLLALSSLTDGRAKMVLALLALNVIATQYFLLFCAGIRCVGRPANEVAWGATARLCEGAATAIGAWLSRDLVVAAALILTNRLLMTSAVYTWLRIIAPWLELNRSNASLDEVKRLFHPSFSYLCVSLAQALVIQGPVIILGSVANAASVVVFSTSRTLVRFGTSLSNLLNNSFTPEYSTIFGRQNDRGFRLLMRIHFVLALGGIALYTLVLRIAGPEVMATWTRGRVHVVEPFFALITYAVTAEMIWTVLFTPIASISRHVLASYSFGILSVAGMVVCVFLARGFGLDGVASALLGVHVATLVVVGWQCWVVLVRADMAGKPMVHSQAA